MVVEQINGFKLNEGRFRLGKKSCTVSVVSHCNMLSTDVVEALALETLKVQLDKALGKLI